MNQTSSIRFAGSVRDGSAVEESRKDCHLGHTGLFIIIAVFCGGPLVDTAAGQDTSFLRMWYAMPARLCVSCIYGRAAVRSSGVLPEARISAEHLLRCLRCCLEPGFLLVCSCLRLEHSLVQALPPPRQGSLAPVSLRPGFLLRLAFPPCLSVIFRPEPEPASCSHSGSVQFSGLRLAILPPASLSQGLLSALLRLPEPFLPGLVPLIL